jgi:hypothetical protein
MARQVIHDPVQFLTRSFRSTVRLRVYLPLPLSPGQPQFRAVRGLMAAGADSNENVLAWSVGISFHIFGPSGQKRNESGRCQYETSSQIKIISWFAVC